MGQLVPQPPVKALSIDPNGTLYIGGSFTSGTSTAKWDGSAWNDSIYEPVEIADTCGFCGVGVQVVDTCGFCGAPPVRKREYRKGEFVVKLYQPGAWDRLRDWVKL